MSLQTNLRRKIEQVLASADDQGFGGPRLKSDALRLWGCIQKFAAMKIVGPDIDLEALELACYALQLSPRPEKPQPGKPNRTNLRQRCEQAAELLVTLFAADISESLLDRATRLLQEVHQRSPVMDDARLLADAVNLDDFGVTGLLLQTIQLALQGEGVAEISLACEKREQYGYWQARLKDGFHFDVVRQLATQRLESARKVAKMLADELQADKP